MLRKCTEEGKGKAQVLGSSIWKGLGDAEFSHWPHRKQEQRGFSPYPMRVGSIQWNYQEISLKQTNKSTLCFFHAPQEGTHGMFCHERLGRSTGSASSNKDFNKFLDMRPPVGHPRVQARASTAALPVRGAGMQGRRGRDSSSICTEPSTGQV